MGSLELDTEQLQSLMRDFYILTGVKIAVFDNECNEIAAYPNGHCAFCSLLRSSPVAEQLCKQSDNKSFDICRQAKKLVIYHCHAGLVEATAPLIFDGLVIGYIMFGQITDQPDRKAVKDRLSSLLQQYNLPPKNDLGIRYKSTEQIHATAKILEACILYVLQKEMISLEKEQFIFKLNQYIKKHISGPITVEMLCDAFSYSRSRLYDLTNRYLGMGVAKYIVNKRIEMAKHLLKNTDLPVFSVAEQTGFSDYNHFCHVFKSRTGASATKYRKDWQQKYTEK